MYIIHVNRNVIDANRKNGTKIPPLAVKTSENGVSTYSNQIDILDDSGNSVAVISYHPDDPLKCGAKVWIEAKNIATDIRLSYTEACELV